MLSHTHMPSPLSHTKIIFHIRNWLLDFMCLSAVAVVGGDDVTVSVSFCAYLFENLY